MNQLRQWWQSPAQRRRLLTAVSGLFIILALVSKYLLDQLTWHNGLMAAAALVAGSDIAQRAWHSLRQRHISIELLVTIAAVGALIIGEYWEAAAVTFLFLFGAYLEARTLGQTRKVLQGLLELAPTTAIVLRNGRQIEVIPHEVALGESVLVKPGAKFPVDGSVVDGRSAVDESAITGESMPVEKFAGTAVFAGTVNQAGLLTVEATGVGADTTLARIIHRVEEAQEEKAPTQRFIERFARYYTPFIIVLSIVAYLVTGNMALALTLLVIGCPGALVISTPVSVVAGIGRAAKRGILIKGGEYLENAGKISALALDKTGTLTVGRPAVTDVLLLQPELAYAGAGLSNDRQQLLRWAAIAEFGSEHPLAQAIVSAVESGDPLPQADSFETFTGRGVRATYRGYEIGVGTPQFMAEMEIAIPGRAQTQLAQLQMEGKTAVFVALDGQVIGILGVADQLRPAAPEMIRHLQETGVQQIVMLTGDNAQTAQAIASAATISDVYAGLLPEDKLDVIRQLQAEGHVVAMIGDGINDSPALAVADIGMAMGVAGTDVAIETADIALMTDDLLKIPEAIRLSKATLNNIRQNVVIALVTVSLLLAGVLLGQVHMAEGMFIHELSVMIVILNGMRLLRV
ncbi:MAG: cation-translocating P-type ATPase [Anaerolineales bacterium]